MIILEWWVFYMKAYNFYKLDSHYKKHVEGNDESDKRPFEVKTRESNHWHEYKNVSNKEQYYDAAIENISESKRVYKYRAYDGGLSINYQKYLLRAFAYYAKEKYKANSGIIESEIIECFSKNMKKYSYNVDALDYLSIFLDLGILSKKDELYCFYHESYQDYFYSEEIRFIIGG